MKLFVFRPDGHGEYTFIVMSESKEMAIEHINKFREKEKIKDDGWETEYYQCEEYNENEVVSHDNA